MINIKDKPDLIKDEETGVIINVDGDAYAAYINNRNVRKKLMDRVDNLENKLDELMRVYSATV